MTKGNPFATPLGAARYAAGRPYFHPIFMGRLAELLPERSLGADIACGTGLSSMALAAIMAQVLAYDSSAAMLALAPAHPCIEYIHAPAEQLPLADHSLDVATVAQAFYWLERGPFLAEIRRVLKANGLLYIYDFQFTGEIVRVPEDNSHYPQNIPVLSEFRQHFIEHYPKEPHQREVFGPQEATEQGFLYHETQFIHTWPFDLAGFVTFLMSQPATLLAAQTGRETSAQTAQWLTEECSPFFANQPQRDFIFRGWQVVMRPLHHPNIDI